MNARRIFLLTVHPKTSSREPVVLPFLPPVTVAELAADMDVLLHEETPEWAFPKSTVLRELFSRGAKDPDEQLARCVERLEELAGEGHEWPKLATFVDNTQVVLALLNITGVR